MIEVFEAKGDGALIQKWIKKIDTANRKAQRAGLGSPWRGVVTGVETISKKIGGVTVEEIVQVLEITGESMSKPGWSFAATVDWTADPPVIRTSPTYEGPTLPRPDSRVCEHCNTVRSRNETFLVVGPDGAVKQVGRQCLTAFTGIPLGWVSELWGLAQTFEGGSRSEPVFPVSSVVRMAVVLTDVKGYVSRNVAMQRGVPSTRDDFDLLWFGPGKDPNHWLQKRYDDLLALIKRRERSDEEVEAEVQEILAWGKSLSSADSDYLLNLHSLLGSEQVVLRNTGYLVSAPASYRRSQERTAKRAAAKAARPEVVEGRHEIQGEVKMFRWDDQWNCLKARIETTTGESLWGTIPSALVEQVEVGTVVAFTATVERSQKDATFGFWKRPTKPRIVA